MKDVLNHSQSYNYDWSNQIKKYDYRNPIDIVYTLIWLEELIPNYNIELASTKNLSSADVLKIQIAIDKWNKMKSKRDK